VSLIKILHLSQNKSICNFTITSAILGLPKFIEDYQYYHQINTLQKCILFVQVGAHVAFGYSTFAIPARKGI